MKLAGLALMGPKDMPMLCIIRRTMFGPYEGHVLAISTIGLLLDARKGSNFHWLVINAK